MKKVLSLLVVLLLSLTLVACSSESASGTLVVGTPKLNGDFVTGFGNSSYDKYVKDILWAYSTYTATPEGEIIVDDTVVKEVKTENDDEGNKTYTFTLNSGLKWSDGTAITAKDYVFSLLWTESNAWMTAGASSTAGEGLVGYSEYHGTVVDAANPGTEDEPNYLEPATSFEGVKYIDESTFSVTISKDKIPYFYETVYATVLPLPMHVWAPGADIAEDGSSLTISASELATFAQKVAETERFKPTVTSGAYSFTSFENQVVTLDLNENYAGDYEGNKGKLEQVIVKYINHETDVDQVISGEVDLVTGVIEGAKIEKAKAASDTTSTNSYKRNGYGMIAFANDFGPTADYRVRQALAYTIDRLQFTQQILGGYGTIVNGEYGLSQWMYVENQNTIDSTLINYTLNTEKANEILDTTDYKYEADGVTPFDSSKAAEGSNYFRYTSSGELLQINHLGTLDNTVTELIKTIWPKGMEEAGIKFTIEMQDFNALLENYYYGYSLGSSRKYHSFNLATGFDVVYDPYYSYSSDFLGTWQNATQTSDAELDSLMEQMRDLDPSEHDKYSELWVKYQTRWNEILPVLPIYSNEYFDIYSNKVEGLVTTPTFTWAHGITKISKSN